MVNSKQKGTRGELLLVREYKKHGFTARRSQQFKGHKDAADILCDELDHLLYPECKVRESINLYDALEKASEECGDKIPHVCLKKNYQPWICVMYLDDFLPLMAQLIRKNNNEPKEICASTNQSGDT